MPPSSPRTSRWLLSLCILVSCVGCDQATKRLATDRLRGDTPISCIADTVRLEYALNPGGFLSLGSQLPRAVRFWFFIVFNAMFLIALAWALARGASMRFSVHVGLAFLLAGGIGNLIDRVWHDGLVTDFIVLGIGPLRTGVFNLADVAVTFGGLAALLSSWASPENDQKRAESK